jgi:hypothetical protein
MPVRSFVALRAAISQCTNHECRLINADGLNPDLSQNDYLVLAGTFHGIHAIAARISPTGQSSGIEVIEAESFKMICLQSPTGASFYLLLVTL